MGFVASRRGFESLGGSEVLKIGWWRRACAGDGLGALG